MTSPVPDKLSSPSPADAPTTVNFYDALRAVAAGKKIFKLEWQDDRLYGILHDGLLMLHRPDDNMLHPWTISNGDMAGTDWVILEN